MLIRAPSRGTRHPGLGVCPPGPWGDRQHRNAGTQPGGRRGRAGCRSGSVGARHGTSERPGGHGEPQTGSRRPRVGADMLLLCPRQRQGDFPAASWTARRRSPLRQRQQRPSEEPALGRTRGKPGGHRAWAAGPLQNAARRARGRTSRTPAQPSRPQNGGAERPAEPGGASVSGCKRPPVHRPVP